MKYKIFFILILLITVATRFIRLDFTPPHLSNDEISIAYDAYSVSQTLRDEHNHFLPLSFQSHNTYKAPLTIYFAIPTIKLFGNNEYSVRLPSAILGSLTVLFIGLLVFELTQNLNLAYLSSFILSITPWHIYTSRMVLESNIALFFVVLGIYLFYRGLHYQNKIITILSFISFAVSIYGYHTEWGFTPLILITLLLINFKKIKRRTVFYFGFFLFLVLVMPIFFDFLKNLGTHARANTEIIFKDPYLVSQLNNSSLNIFQKSQKIFQSIVGSYASHLNLNHLFFDGLNLFPKNIPFQSGLFFAPFLPCFLIGLFNFKKYFQNNSKFFYTWLIISPLIPSLTQGGPNFVRNLVSVVPYTIIISIGLLVIVNFFKFKYKIAVISGILSLSFFYFGVFYFYHFPKNAGENFQYGYKQIAQFIQKHDSEYEKIIIDPRFGDYNLYSGVPHLYISYFTYLDPQIMLARQEVNGLKYGKYEIRDINWNLEVLKKSILYVVPASNLPSSDKNLYTLLETKLPNQKLAFKLFTFK